MQRSLFISACKSNESNYEYFAIGSLIYALYTNRVKLFSISYIELQGIINLEYNKFNLIQTSIVEYPIGSDSQYLF